MRALFALLVVVAGTPAHARDASPAVNLATPRIDSSCATSPSTCGAFSLRFDDARRAADEHHAAIVARNAGIASTVIGTVASVVGAALIGANACIDCSSTNGNALIAGSALLVLGQVGVVVGVPTWVRGALVAKQAGRASLSISAAGAKLTF